MSSRVLRTVIFSVLFFSAIAPGFAGEELRDLSVPLPADRKALGMIRILVQRDKPQVKISVQAPFEVFDDQGRRSGRQCLPATAATAAGGQTDFVRETEQWLKIIASFQFGFLWASSC